MMLEKRAHQPICVFWVVPAGGQECPLHIVLSVLAPPI